MPKLPKCPNCRSENILISYEKEEGLNFLVLFLGILYIFVLLFKWAVGLVILCLYDAWHAIIEKHRGRSHLFRSKKWFHGSKKSYYCQDCKTHFKE
jgi:dolichol kinase